MWLCLVLLGATGCGTPSQDEIVLSHWTLGSEAVTLPSRSAIPTPSTHRSGYELSTEVDLPEAWRGRALTLELPMYQGMPTLFVGTSFSFHSTTEGLLDRHRSTRAPRFELPEAVTAEAKLPLRIITPHPWAVSGWWDAAPVLRLQSSRASSSELVEVVNNASARAAFATSLFVALLYMFLFFAAHDERKRSYSLFALVALSNLAYPATLLGLTQPLFGLYEVTLVSFALSLGAALASLFSRQHFGLSLRPLAWIWAGWIGVFVIVSVFVINPFRAVYYVAPLAVLSVIGNVLSQVYVAAKFSKVIPRPKNLYLLTLAWPATALTGLPDVLGWSGLGGPLGSYFMGFRTANLGVTVISILQATVILRDHLRSMKRVDLLNQELAMRVDALEAKQREVELLNDDLRRQIRARSSALVDELAKPGSTTDQSPRVVLLAGDLVESRYKVVRLLGEGGMGAVHEVERVADGRHFAMKTLSTVSDPVARARFAREAQISSNVKHPNVVALFDFDVAKEGYLFLVMELVEGNTLNEVRKRSLDIPWTLNVLAQVAEGLDAIHAQGIIHRDLKPANVLLSRGKDGRKPLVKITDFGVSSMIVEELHSESAIRIARAFDKAFPERSIDSVPTAPESRGPGDTRPLDDERDDFWDLFDTGSLEANIPVFVDQADEKKVGPTLTRPGIVFGTPNYMAAELVSGRSSKAADVFSFGVIAFELFTQKRPFRRCPLRVAIEKKPLPNVPHIPKVIPDLPAEAATLLERSLSHDPTVRPSAREIAAVFRRYSGSPPIMAPESRPSVRPT
ncbi:MAG: protein kinase [Polyangiaceae bacterium]|nr:protein kinase [Polyangiaceae bacterium]